MSWVFKIRSEHLRKVSYLFLAVCLLNIGWSWPFSKSRATGDAQRVTEKEQNLPVVEAGATGQPEEIVTSDGKGYRQSATPAEQKSDEPFLEITRSDDSASYVTRSISVIGQEEIQNSTARYVPELLKSKAGIVVSETYDNPKGMNVDIRGSGDTAKRNVLVLVDGRRTNQMDISGADWSAIPLEIVERIEVIRGPSSVLYGDNASGGVINIVTKKAKPGIHAKAETEIGLHKYKRDGGTVSAENDWARGLFHYENTQDNGWRANTNYWANDWFGKLGLGPFYGVGLDLSAGHHRDRNGLPGALFMSNIEQMGRGGTRFDGDHAWSQETFFTAAPRWNFEWDGNSFELSGFNSFRRRLSKADFPSAGPQDTRNDIDSYEFQPKLSWTRQFNEWIRSKMTGGVDFFNGKNDIQSAASWMVGGLEKIDIHKKSLGVYLMENLSFWDKLLLNLGFRGEWAKYQFNEREAVWNQDTSGMRNAAFDFGAGYKYQERSLAYFDISRSFRFPATDEFYGALSAWGTGLDTGLKQQQEMNYELGVRDNTWKPLNVAMNVFLADIKDEIYYDPSTFANSNYASPTRRYGFEMESSLKFFEKRWFNIAPFFNLTTQKPYFKGGSYANKEIPFVPSFKYATGFVIEPIKGFTLSAELNHLSQQFAINDEDNSMAKMKAYTTVDLKAQYNWKWAKAWVSLTNLFNVNYSTYAVSNGAQVGYYPAQGFGFVSGMSLEY